MLNLSHRLIIAFNHFQPISISLNMLTLAAFIFIDSLIQDEIPLQSIKSLKEKLKNYPKTIDPCFFLCPKTRSSLTVPSVISAKSSKEFFFVWIRIYNDFLFFSAGALIKSQFPVFTIYAQKTCLKRQYCDRPWTIDRVQGYGLKNHIKRSATAETRQECYEMCFNESDFLCRWVQRR